jgi:DNA-directed RNA polymerase sigma subunit (sigma70/sigma32)
MRKISKKYETPQVPFEYTLEEIAKNLGISKERVRQIEYQALRKIRKYGQPLKEYVYG